MMANRNTSTMARVSGALLASLLAVTFFFAIIGVFGLPIAIGALVLCLLLTVWVSSRASESGVPK